MKLSIYGANIEIGWGCKQELMHRLLMGFAQAKFPCFVFFFVNKSLKNLNNLEIQQST